MDFRSTTSCVVLALNTPSTECAKVGDERFSPSVAMFPAAFCNTWCIPEARSGEVISELILTALQCSLTTQSQHSWDTRVHGQPLLAWRLVHGGGRLLLCCLLPWQILLSISFLLLLWRRRQRKQRPNKSINSVLLSLPTSQFSKGASLMLTRVFLCASPWALRPTTAFSYIFKSRSEFTWGEVCEILVILWTFLSHQLS